jgi:hypothetical protein
MSDIVTGRRVKPGTLRDLHDFYNSPYWILHKTLVFWGLGYLYWDNTNSNPLLIRFGGVACINPMLRT